MLYVLGENPYFQYEPRHYSSEENLRNYLQIVLELFINKGHQWIIENSIKKFNALAVYQECFDDKLKSYGLIRSYTDENIINGGKVIYEKSDLNVKFQHYKDKTSVDCFISKLNEQIALKHIFDNEADIGFYRFPQFTIKDEYISILESYLKVIFEKYASLL